MNDSTKQKMAALFAAATKKAQDNTPQNFSTSTGAPDQKPAAPAAPPVGALLKQVEALPVKLQDFTITMHEGTGDQDGKFVTNWTDANKLLSVIYNQHGQRLGYSKTFIKVCFSNMYILNTRIDISHKAGDFNPYRESIAEYLTRYVDFKYIITPKDAEPLPAPAPIFKPTVADIFGTQAAVSVDDLLNNAINTDDEETAPEQTPAAPAPQIYVEMPKATPVTIAPPAAPKAQQITNGTYTMHQYFTVTGKLPNDTIKIKNELRRMGGVYVPGADCGSCWLFPMKKMYIVKNFLGLV